MKTNKPKCKFHVGQVVLIDVDFYKQPSSYSSQRFQKITRVWPWHVGKAASEGFGLSFLNHDQCHEKFVRALTKKESE